MFVAKPGAIPPESPTPGSGIQFFNSEGKPRVCEIQDLAQALNLDLGPGATIPAENVVGLLQFILDSVNPLIPSNKVLTANRTYFVRTDGDDGNDGLSDSASGAFRTLQKAIDTIAQLDLNGFTVTIQLADGTYTFTGNTVSKSLTGGGRVIIQGNSSNPSNVIVTSTGATRTLWIQHVDYTLRNFRLQGGSVFSLQIDSRVAIQGMAWGANTVAAVIAISGNGYLFCDSGSGNWQIIGNSTRFIWAFLGGSAFIDNITVNLISNPVFSQEFALADQGGHLWFSGTVFSGAATGVRHRIRNAGGIVTSNLLPGNSNVQPVSPGYYVGP